MDVSPLIIIITLPPPPPTTVAAAAAVSVVKDVVKLCVSVGIGGYYYEVVGDSKYFFYHLVCDSKVDINEK